MENSMYSQQDEDNMDLKFLNSKQIQKTPVRNVDGSKEGSKASRNFRQNDQTISPINYQRLSHGSWTNPLNEVPYPNRGMNLSMVSKPDQFQSPDLEKGKKSEISKISAGPGAQFDMDE